MTDALIIIACGLVGGVMAGTFGVGGGTVFVPVLALVAGLTPIQAIGTSLLAIVPVALVGAWQQRGADLRVAHALALGGAAVVTGALGAVLADHLPASTLRYAFAGLLVVIAVRLARSTRRTSRDATVR